MKNIIFKPTNENFTEKVVSALAENNDGVSIKFEKGEYHFFPEGAMQKYFAPTNNGNGVKNIAFPIIGMKNVKIDGGGSTFIFHGNTFPFIVSESENVEICNFVSTMARMPYILMKIGELYDDGFTLVMHPDTNYSLDDEGHLFLYDENGNFVVNSKTSVFSLHSMDRICITYLCTGQTTANKKILATNHHETVAEDMGNRTVFLRYMPSDDPRAIKCRHYAGENIGIIVGGRSRDVFFLADSSEIKISDVTVKRGLGMGIIGQCCHNVSVNGFNAIPNEGEPASLTADALHFVNCTGLLDIRNCEVRSSMDDMLNVHGMYTFVTEVKDDCFKIRIGHHEQSNFLPYRNGDKLRIIDQKTLDIKGDITFDSYEFVSDDCRDAIIRVKEPEKLSLIAETDVIEDPDRMPDVNFIGNRGIDIPRVLMAGGKRYYYAENYLCGFTAALSAEDVPNYWYESGRLSELIMENNIIDAKNRFNERPMIRIGVSGFKEDAPKVHEKVVIRNNKFRNMTNKNPILANGVKELIVEGNEIV